MLSSSTNLHAKKRLDDVIGIKTHNDAAIHDIVENYFAPPDPREFRSSLSIKKKDRILRLAISVCDLQVNLYGGCDWDEFTFSHAIPANRSLSPSISSMPLLTETNRQDNKTQHQPFLSLPPRQNNTGFFDESDDDSVYIHHTK